MLPLHRCSLIELAHKINIVATLGFVLRELRAAHWLDGTGSRKVRQEKLAHLASLLLMRERYQLFPRFNQRFLLASARFNLRQTAGTVLRPDIQQFGQTTTARGQVALH
jgi:hypothetical protein